MLEEQVGHTLQLTLLTWEHVAAEPNLLPSAPEWTLACRG